jgi:hypothetical protein
MEVGRELQGQNARRVLKETPTVCGYLCGHSVEVFHLITPKIVDDLFQTSEIRFFFFFGLTLSGRTHLDEDLVVCQG